MAKTNALRCPNCNALVSRKKHRCEYCGAELVLSPDGSFFSLRFQNQCPKCGAISEASSWLCVNCRTVLTKDVEMLKKLQKKIKFEQGRTRSFLPSWMREKLEPNEFIHFCFYWTKDGNQFYVVTDERIIKSKAGKYEESPWNEVISVGDPQVRLGAFAPSTFFEVNTSKGTVLFDGFGVKDAANCGKLYGTMRTTLDNYNQGKKDIRAIILALNL